MLHRSDILSTTWLDLLRLPPRITRLLLLIVISALVASITTIFVLLVIIGGRNDDRYRTSASGQIARPSAIHASIHQHHQPPHANNWYFKGVTWPFLPEHLQLDPHLIEHIRSKVLIPPADRAERYNLSHPEVKDPSWPAGRQHILTDIYPQFFNGVKNGTFFEAGALDGERLSSTLYMEREHGWRGLLAEMTPLNYQLILNKRRRAYFAPVCISPLPWPIQIVYNAADKDFPKTRATISQMKVDLMLRQLAKKAKPSAGSPGAQVQQLEVGTYVATVDCYPLYSLLAAAGITKIDFLSLDVEGVELQVLKTIPWDLVDIKVLHLDLVHVEEGVAATKEFLIGKKYIHISGELEPVVYVKEGWINKP